MTDAPDELESAMILGDPGETVSLDTIKAMARAVRDAGYGNIEAERARIVAALDLNISGGTAQMEYDAAMEEAIAIVKGEA